MLALCVEASHARGMGHLFRASVLARTLLQAGHATTVYINDNAAACDVLRRLGLPFETVPLESASSDWEIDAIARNGITKWINDRHETDVRSSRRVKSRNVPLVTFDDRGSGAADADLHVAALAFDDKPLGGRRILRGTEYLILDPEIARHRRIRKAADKCIVTLGGADTYGVTPKIVRILSRQGRGATVVVGPAFRHEAELAAAVSPDFEVKRNVRSLIDEFARHDYAITGGGMTPFEANASGLPCIVVANETFEIPVGQALESFGGALFAGYHTDIDEAAFNRPLPVESMSSAALARVSCDGTHRVAQAILAL